MSISFNSIPNNILVPLVAMEFDNTRANQGPALLAYRALLVAQKIAAGSAAANSLVRVTSEAQAIAYCGRGSQGHRMAKAFLRLNKQTELWILVLEDNGAGVAATKTITVTGPATAAGTIYLYVGEDLVQVAVAAGDTANNIAAAINAAINAAGDLPLTSAVATNVVTTTARNKGVAGQDQPLRVNYQDGEALPAGVGIAIANVTAGITNPVLTSGIAALGDTWFHVVAHPYYDATSLAALEAEALRRVGPMVSIDMSLITSSPGTVSGLGTLGDSRNSQHSCIVAAPGENPMVPPCEFAAACAAIVAAAGSADPGRPFQTLALTGFKAPKEADLFTQLERNQLLGDGISTTSVAAGGVMQLERMVTTYQTNAVGAPDTSYRDLTSILTLMYFRYSLRLRFQQKFSRHKLANDGVRPSAGQAVVTPKIAKAECIAWFKEMSEELFLGEGLAQFKRDLQVVRNATDPNRLDMLVPPDLINQLIVTAAKIQFLL
jgi:phage tail sheath gpL-like